MAGRVGGDHRMKHTVSVHVEDKPGALARISTMFARRGFNIESLAVGPTERPGVSRITLRVDCEQHSLEQVEKQMHKLVNVLRVTELAPGDALERELLLIKVAVPPDRRAAVVFEVAGTPEELESFQELCRPHGIKELVRTGRVGIGRASNRPAPRRLSAIN